MKRLKNHIFSLFILFVFSISFFSCISIERNIRINTDGSGIETINIEYKKEFFQMMIALVSAFDSTRVQSYTDSLYNDEMFIKEMKISLPDSGGIKVNNITSRTNPDSSKTVTIDYNFNEVKSIGESMSKNSTSGNMTGITTVTFTIENNRRVFSYIYEKVKADSVRTTDSLNTPDLTGFSRMFENNKLVFNIEFPFNVISSNAVFTEGNKLRWEFDMSDVISGEEGFRLEAVME